MAIICNYRGADQYVRRTLARRPNSRTVTTRLENAVSN